MCARPPAFLGEAACHVEPVPSQTDKLGGVTKHIYKGGKDAQNNLVSGPKPRGVLINVLWGVQMAGRERWR